VATDEHLLQRGAAAAAKLLRHVRRVQAQLTGSFAVGGGQIGGKLTA